MGDKHGDASRQLRIWYKNHTAFRGGVGESGGKDINFGSAAVINTQHRKEDCCQLERFVGLAGVAVVACKLTVFVSLAGAGFRALGEDIEDVLLCFGIRWERGSNVATVVGGQNSDHGGRGLCNC